MFSTLSFFLLPRTLCGVVLHCHTCEVITDLCSSGFLIFLASHIVVRRVLNWHTREVITDRCRSSLLHFSSSAFTSLIVLFCRAVRRSPMNYWRLRARLICHLASFSICILAHLLCHVAFCAMIHSCVCAIRYFARNCFIDSVLSWQ